MKILTKYVVKPYFYNVILRMIFWNMEPVGIIPRVEKKFSILPQSLMGIPMEWYMSVFYRELKKNYRILPLSPTAILTDGAHPKTHACQTAWSVGTVTDRFADGHGKSNALVL